MQKFCILPTKLHKILTYVSETSNHKSFLQVKINSLRVKMVPCVGSKRHVIYHRMTAEIDIQLKQTRKVCYCVSDRKNCRSYRVLKIIYDNERKVSITAQQQSQDRSLSILENILSYFNSGEFLLQNLRMHVGET